MKYLITVTCIAILTTIGYFFWSEWDAYRVRAILQAQQEAENTLRDAAQNAQEEADKAELFSLIYAQPHEIDRVKRFCWSLTEDHSALAKHRERDRWIANCGKFGFFER